MKPLYALLCCAVAGATLSAQGRPEWAALAAQRDSFAQSVKAMSHADAAREARELADATLAVLAGEGEWESQRIRLAWECSAAVAEAGALDAAERVQRELHDRLKATWTVLNLTLTLSRLGAYEAAEFELRRQLQQIGGAAPDAERGALVYQSALLALGQGDERRGRNLLGRALALGSEDAVVVLGWLHLRAGNSRSARALFRNKLASESPGNAAWSLRGWGLSMLPRSSTSTAYNHPVDPRRSAGPR